jgi:SAM-dependent methyltransferase
MIRNLYYNCFAHKLTPKVWKDNIRTLCRYRDVFNGRKIVVIKVDVNTADPDEVKAEFDLPGVEFVVWPNDPVLHEKAGFLETLEKLKSDNPDEITFYAHTKGSGKHQYPLDHHVSVKQWRNRAYYECLRDPTRIDAALQHYAAAGCFRRDHHKIGEHQEFPWIFAGTFYWFNHKKLFERDWKKIVDQRDGPEVYLSGMFDTSEIYTLYDAPVHFYHDMYSVSECSRCGKIRTTRYQLLACPQCDQPVEFKRFAGMYHNESDSKPTRVDLINRLILAREYESYLEIGLRGEPRAFENIRVKNKVSVDPEKEDATHTVSSDEFFAGPGKDTTFDLIFIDGLHHADQAQRDIDNALERLNEGGIIVVHDCLPDSEPMQRVPRETGVWTGDVWKTFAWYRQNRPDLSMCVVDIDYGCGFIEKGCRVGQELQPEAELTWDYYEKNSRKLLNVISLAEFVGLLWHNWEHHYHHKEYLGRWTV